LGKLTSTSDVEVKKEREREKDRIIDWKMGYGGGLEREESSLDERKWSL
jgi:hypothetical protein